MWSIRRWWSGLRCKFFDTCGMCGLVVILVPSFIQSIVVLFRDIPRWGSVVIAIIVLVGFAILIASYAMYKRRM